MSAPTRQVRQKIITVFRETGSVMAVARELGCGRQVVIRVLDETGIPRRRHLTDKLRCEIFAEYEQVRHIPTVAKRLSLPNSTVKLAIARTRKILADPRATQESEQDVRWNILMAGGPLQITAKLGSGDSEANAQCLRELGDSDFDIAECVRRLDARWDANDISIGVYLRQLEQLRRRLG